jgi:hypothetical protein
MIYTDVEGRLAYRRDRYIAQLLMGRVSVTADWPPPRGPWWNQPSLKEIFAELMAKANYLVSALRGSNQGSASIRPLSRRLSGRKRA